MRIVRGLLVLFVSFLASIGLAAFTSSASAQEANQHTVDVRAKGDSGAERIRLMVGSETVGTFDLTTNWTTYSFTVDTPTTTAEIAVVYNNDAGKADRSIRVDHIVVDGSVYETEAPGVLSSGSFNPRSSCKDGYNESDELSCSGRFVYDAALGLPAVSSDQTMTNQTWVTHCGPITSDEVWSASTVHVVSCPVDIDNASHLQIEAGAIVKFEPQAHGAGIIVNEGSSLEAVSNTSATPIIFTSNYDDARGGDTNGHRSSSTLRPGRYGTPITVAPGAVAKLNNALIDYAAVGIGDIGSSSTKPATIAITNSIIQRSFYLGVNFDEPQTEASITRTVFDSNRLGAARFADKASITGFGVNGQAGNYFDGKPANRQIYLADVDVPENQSWTFGPSRGALLTLEKAQSLNVDGRLNVEGGSIIKISTAGVKSAITARTGGTVKFWGNKSAPVTITSVLDDTAGGDTNLDGAASKPRKGAYEVAIRVQAGSKVQANYIIAKYGKNGIAGERTDSEEPATLLVGYSLFEANDYFGIHVNKAPITAIIYGNTFKDNRLGGVRFTTGNSPEGFYTEGSAGNKFVGLDSGRQVWMGGAKLPANRAFVFSADANAVLTLEHSRSLIAEGTVVIKPGAIVKVSSNERLAGLHIAETGRVYLSGSSSKPIIVTSVLDDKHGGDSNGDGDKAKPRIGGHRTFAFVSPGAVLQTNNVEIQYARNAIVDVKGDSSKTAYILMQNTTIRDTKVSAVDLKQATTKASFSRVVIENAPNGIRVEDAQVRFRGAFVDTEMDIRACNYGGTCAVDAAYVNWGNPATEGPFVSGTPTACGNVRVSYWKDQGSADRNVHFTKMNCDGTTFTP